MSRACFALFGIVLQMIYVKAKALSNFKQQKNRFAAKELNSTESEFNIEIECVIHLPIACDLIRSIAVEMRKIYAFVRQHNGNSMLRCKLHN